MLLQLPAEFDLGAVLPRGAVIRQDEVGVQAVQHRQLAHGIGHGLVRSDHLYREHGTVNKTQPSCAA